MDLASAPTWTTLLDAAGRLKASWPTPAWKWDGRLVALECAFDKAVEAQARSSLAPLLPASWTSATLSTAPASYKAVAARTGGMRAGQLLFASQADDAALGAFGLWWPWSNGALVTLRIGLIGAGAADEPFRQLRELFGVKP